MSKWRNPSVLAVCAWAAALALSALMVFATQTKSEDGFDSLQPLVREVVSNELKAQQRDHTPWQYREMKSQDGEAQLFEIVETKQGDLQRMIAVNGKPLAPPRARKEDERIQHLVSNPKILQDERRKEAHDSSAERNLLAMLPDAFRYREVGREDGMIKLDFLPNPAFHASNREAEVFHHMQGSLWIDEGHKRLARLSGQLVTEVKFGGGILGHLAKGGTFLVEQRDVGNGDWELTKLDVNMNGRILFFKTINVKQKQEDSDFKPVSAGITLKEAAQLLQRESPAPGAPVGAAAKR